MTSTTQTDPVVTARLLHAEGYAGEVGKLYPLTGASSCYFHYTLTCTDPARCGEQAGPGQDRHEISLFNGQTSRGVTHNWIAYWGYDANNDITANGGEDCDIFGSTLASCTSSDYSKITGSSSSSTYSSYTIYAPTGLKLAQVPITGHEWSQQDNFYPKFEACWASATPGPTSQSSNDHDGSSTSGLSLDEKAGIGAGIAVALLILIGLAVFFGLRWRKARARRALANNIHSAGGRGPYGYGNVVYYQQPYRTRYNELAAGKEIQELHAQSAPRPELEAREK